MYFAIYSLHLLGACLDINWFFFGLEEFKLTTIRNTIVKLLTVISVFVFIKGNYALEAYFIIVAGSTLVSGSILWTKIPKKVKFYIPSIKEILVHIKPNVILFVPILAMSVYRVMDKIMIKGFCGVIENGYYENADRIITISLTVFAAVATVMMPTVSNMIAKEDSNGVKRIFYDTIQITNCLSIAMTFGIIAISREFAPLFFGSEFVESGYLLMGLAPVIFFSGWKNVIRSQYLIPYEKDRAYVVSLVMGALVNIVVNLIFIPRFGARGAVIGTIAAEITGFVVQTYVASKEISFKTVALNTLIFIPSGVFMMLSVIFLLRVLPYSLMSILFVVLIGGIIYISSSLLILFIFDKKSFYYYQSRIMVFMKKE